MSMAKFQPYNFDGLTKLLQYFYGLGWYSNTQDLLIITMQGGFEAFSGRASETWEQRFVVESVAIPDLGRQSYKAIGETLNEACISLLGMLPKS